MTILSIEDSVEFNNHEFKNVVATDAAAAMKKIRLVKTKKKQAFVESVVLISHIDKI